VWKSKFDGVFVLNYRVVLHVIDATPARWRSDASSSPLDRARAAASSPRNDLVKNYRVHPTHWLISTQVVTGEVSGACYARAAFSFARAPGTNAYLLVVDDISIGTPPGEKATGFQFSCSVENGLYTPGAYELINGSCGLLHAVPEHPITCPAQTDYLPDASCPSDGAPATRPAFVGLLLAAVLAIRI
jgi:hypothetical protein